MRAAFYIPSTPLSTLFVPGILGVLEEQRAVTSSTDFSTLILPNQGFLDSVQGRTVLRN